jgi:uncharacterized protein (DUF952 family)
MVNRIYHIVTLASWEAQLVNDFYIHESLDTEGFIHASTAAQLEATIQRYYADCEKVIVLTIDTNLLTAELKYELAPSVNELFPHLYGRLNKSAIVHVEERLV